MEGSVAASKVVPNSQGCEYPLGKICPVYGEQLVNCGSLGRDFRGTGENNCWLARIAGIYLIRYGGSPSPRHAPA